MRSTIKTIRGLPGPAMSSRALNQLLLQGPRTKVFMTVIKPIALPAAPPPPTQPELSKEAKQDLMMGSMLHKDVNKSLGLGFDDTTVTGGATYQYAIRELDAAGNEGPTDVATTQITVGADPQPATPTGLEAAQIDPDTIDLRWSRLTQEQEEPFGVASYNLIRVDPRNAAGLKIN